MKNDENKSGEKNRKGEEYDSSAENKKSKNNGDLLERPRSPVHVDNEENVKTFYKKIFFAAALLG